MQSGPARDNAAWRGEMDIVEIARNVTIIALAIAAVGAIVLTSANLASSTLALSTSALIGTALVFCLQLFFELKSSTDIDHVSTSFTLDASVPSIRQWTYPLNTSWRIGAEVGASTWLKQNNPLAFSADRDKLFADFTIFSFISFLMTTEFDWQLRTIEYPAGSFGTGIVTAPISKEKECTVYRQEDVKAKLKAAGNVFADVPSSGAHKLCLPPHTKFEISPRSITFETRLCQVTWKLDEIPIMMDHMKPGSQTADVPTTASGKPQFDSRVSGLNAEVTYFARRAKSLDPSDDRFSCVVRE